MERILHLGMERIGQFVGEPAVRGLIDEGLDGGEQCAVAREPDRLMGPEAGVVEAGGFSQSVVAPAMSIAGQVVEELEFAKDGETGSGGESGPRRTPFRGEAEQRSGLIPNTIPG